MISKQQRTMQLPWTTPLGNGNGLDKAMPTRVQWAVFDRRFLYPAKKIASYALVDEFE